MANSENNSNDGQHRDWPGNPQELQGQRTKLIPGLNVGQECGPALNMKVPATRQGSDIECGDCSEE